MRLDHVRYLHFFRCFKRYQGCCCGKYEAVWYVRGLERLLGISSWKRAYSDRQLDLTHTTIVPHHTHLHSSHSLSDTFVCPGSGRPST